MKRFFFLLMILPSYLRAEQVQINFKEVFSSAPIIYIILALLSISAVMVTIYAFLASRSSELMPKYESRAIFDSIKKRNPQLALDFCHHKRSLFTLMMAAGIESRPYGYQVMIDAIKGAGKRHSASLWQKISLLNDIAIIAPMLGLLGTVSGMFYAFYDLNRSLESLTGLFDGLGVSVGTTLAGLIVAILAMILSTLLKHRLIKTMTFVENEALTQAMRLTHESHS